MSESQRIHVESQMANWFDNWVRKKRERVNHLEDAASGSGAVVDPDETIEDIQYDSDFGSDATIPDPNFLDGYLSEDDDLGAYGQLDLMLKREDISTRRPC